MVYTLCWLVGQHTTQGMHGVLSLYLRDEWLRFDCGVGDIVSAGQQSPELMLGTAFRRWGRWLAESNPKPRVEPSSSNTWNTCSVSRGVHP